MATFSEALEEVKNGSVIYREGWNGKNQFVVHIDPGNAMFTKYNMSARMQDCLGLKNAQGNMQPGWVPSQGDLFANDWIIETKQG